MSTFANSICARRITRLDQTEDLKVQQKQPHPRSIEGFASRHGISRATVYNLHHRGLLNFTKIGRRTVITEQQEAAWLAKSERGYA